GLHEGGFGARTRKPSMYSIIWLISTVISIYIAILIVSAVLSWLVAFDVVNRRNPIVAQVGEVLYRLTEPVLGPIRRRLPNLGGLDISPVIVILLLMFAQRLLYEYVPNAFY